MPIKIGNISAKDVYIGSTPAKEIRLGSTLIWSRAQEEVYYTLTIDASGAINGNGDSIFDYAFGQYRMPGSNEWIQILDAGGDYHLDNGESILLPAGSEISLAVNSMDYNIPISISINNFILSENTTVYFIAQSIYTLTINLGEGVDYSDIWYKEPGTTEWVERSKYTSLNAPAGTEFYVIAAPVNGYVIDSSINLGSQSNPLTLNANTTIDITAHPVVVENNYTLTIDASGASNFDYAFGQYKAPNSSEWIQILDANGDYHLDNRESILLPAGSEISLGVNSMDSNPISISINDFILSENTTVYFTSELAYYTLAVNIEGNSEAYYDGYTIYVNESEFARIDHSDTFSIPSGATVRTYNNSFGINGYTHSESIVPLPSPSFSTGDSWVMDKDYSITVVAEKNYTLTINLGEGVDYSDIWYKEPGATEWTEASKYTSLTAPAGTKFYIYTQPMGGYKIDSDINLGSQSNPLTLNANTTIDITAHPVVIEEEYEFNVASGGGASITSISIKIGNDVVYSRSGSNLSGTEYPIKHDGSKPIYVKVGTLGYIESWTWSGSSGFTTLPSTGYDGYQILFENLQETGTLTVNLTSS